MQPTVEAHTRGETLGPLAATARRWALPTACGGLAARSGPAARQKPSTRPAGRERLSLRLSPLSRGTALSAEATLAGGPNGAEFTPTRHIYPEV